MPWRYRTEDNAVGVVVDPDFNGLVDRALEMPVWVVDTPENRAEIALAMSIGDREGLFEVRPVRVGDSSDRRGNLLRILPELDEEYGKYAFLFIFGLDGDRVGVEHFLAAEGFKVQAIEGSRISAIMLPEVRGPLIGRNYLDPRLSCLGLHCRTKP